MDMIASKRLQEIAKKDISYRDFVFQRLGVLTESATF